MFFFLSWSSFSLPATFSLVAAALEATSALHGLWAFQSVIKRLPIMIAPIFGGMLIDRFGNHPGRAHRADHLDLSLRTEQFSVTRQLRQESNDLARVAAADRPAAKGLEFLAKLGVPFQFADEAFCS